MDAVMELEIGPGPDPGSFVVRVLQSVGGGEPSETFRLDLDDLLSPSTRTRGERPAVLGSPRAG
jgi:hypothetical protein